MNNRIKKAENSSETAAVTELILTIAGSLTAAGCWLYGSRLDQNTSLIIYAAACVLAGYRILMSS